jgi:hypothetical protein
MEACQCTGDGVEYWWSERIWAVILLDIGDKYAFTVASLGASDWGFGVMIKVVAFCLGLT